MINEDRGKKEKERVYGSGERDRYGINEEIDEVLQMKRKGEKKLTMQHWAERGSKREGAREREQERERDRKGGKEFDIERERK